MAFSPKYVSSLEEWRLMTLWPLIPKALVIGMCPALQRGPHQTRPPNHVYQVSHIGEKPSWSSRALSWSRTFCLPAFRSPPPVYFRQTVLMFKSFSVLKRQQSNSELANTLHFRGDTNQRNTLLSLQFPGVLEALCCRDQCQLVSRGAHFDARISWN